MINQNLYSGILKEYILNVKSKILLKMCHIIKHIYRNEINGIFILLV